MAVASAELKPCADDRGSIEKLEQTGMQLIMTTWKTFISALSSAFEGDVVRFEGDYRISKVKSNNAEC